MSEASTTIRAQPEVSLVPSAEGLRATLRNAGADGGCEYAFYLFLDGERFATRWYGAEPHAIFPGPHPAGRYEAVAFSRVPGTSTVERHRSRALDMAPPREAPSASLENAPGVVVHIGLPKTGTTYLQRTFHRALGNAAALPLDYPDTDFYNHQIALYEPLGAFLPWKPRPGAPELWKKLDARLRTPGDRRILLSAEALSGLETPGIELFRSLLHGRPVERVVITTRALASLLPSHWQQNMKQGGRGTLERYADRILRAIREARSPSQMFCVSQTVRLWRKVFPDTPISVLEMDGAQAQNLLAFAEICGLGVEHDRALLQSVPPASEQNLSFSVDECRQLIEINEAIARGTLDVSARKKAMDAFFLARDKRVTYEKPVLDGERAAAAREVDHRSREALAALPGCKWIHGRERRQPAAVS